MSNTGKTLKKLLLILEFDQYLKIRINKYRKLPVFCLILFKFVKNTYKIVILKTEKIVLREDFLIIIK